MFFERSDNSCWDLPSLWFLSSSLCLHSFLRSSSIVRMWKTIGFVISWSLPIQCLTLQRWRCAEEDHWKTSRLSNQASLSLLLVCVLRSFVIFGCAQWSTSTRQRLSKFDIRLFSVVLGGQSNRTSRLSMSLELLNSVTPMGQPTGCRKTLHELMQGVLLDSRTQRLFGIESKRSLPVSVHLRVEWTLPKSFPLLPPADLGTLRWRTDRRRSSTTMVKHLSTQDRRVYRRRSFDFVRDVHQVSSTFIITVENLRDQVGCLRWATGPSHSSIRHLDDQVRRFSQPSQIHDGWKYWSEERANSAQTPSIDVLSRSADDLRSVRSQWSECVQERSRRWSVSEKVISFHIDHAKRLFMCSNWRWSGVERRISDKWSSAIDKMPKISFIIQSNCSVKTSPMETNNWSSNSSGIWLRSILMIHYSSPTAIVSSLI
jgi:hypothetical protein